MPNTMLFLLWLALALAFGLYYSIRASIAAKRTWPLSRGTLVLLAAAWSLTTLSVLVAVAVVTQWDGLMWLAEAVL